MAAELLALVARFAWLMWLAFVSYFDGKPLLVLLHHSVFSFTIIDEACTKSLGTKLVHHYLSVLHDSVVVAFGAWILLSEAITNGVWKILDCKELMYGAWDYAYGTVCFSCGFILCNQMHCIHNYLYSDLVLTLIGHFLQLVGFTFPLYGDVMINSSLLIVVFVSLFDLCRRIKLESGLTLRPVTELAYYRIQRDQTLV